MDLNKLDFLKEGNFAKIYTKEEVAYKVGNLSCKEILRGQFELLSEINDPHFVSVYDWFEEKDKCGFSMEKIASPSIDQVFKKPPSEKEDFEKIKNILLSTLDALWVLHSKGIICGDLKPTHIFADKNNNVKLIDPGYDPNIITPSYAAPEALTDSPDFSSDIYSVGIIFYEILTGEKAFKGSLSNIIELKLKKGLPPSEKINPSIPEEMNLLIQRMTAKDLNNRLKNIEDVKRELTLGTPAVDKKPSFVSLFTGREKELKEFDNLINRLPDPRIILVKGERGSGKSALLNHFKIRALCRGLITKEITSGELYRLLSDKKPVSAPIILLLANVSSVSDISGILKENAIKIRVNPFIIVISLNDEVSDIEELSDITTTFTLNPLNKKEITFIIDKNFPLLENKEELISFLTEQSGGNPSLLNQTIGILIKEGVLERKRDKIFFKQEKVSSVPLPKNIEDNLKFQIENLPEEEKKVLKILSISPEKFPLDSISVFEVKDPYISINSLISKNFLQKDKKGINFKNDWVREFLYKKLTPKDKESIYGKIKKEISSPEVLYVLQKDLGMKKEYRDSLIKIAKKRIKEKEYPEGIKFLKESLSIEDSKIIRITVARLDQLVGNVNEALSFYKKLLSEDRKNAFYLLRIGTLEERHGHNKKAEDCFRKAVKFAKGKIKAQAIYSLCYRLIRGQKLDEASGLISDFKKEEGELPLHLKYIDGRILCGKGEYEKTLRIVEKVLSKDLSPEMKRDFCTLGGLAELWNGEGLKAMKYFQRSIDISKEEKDLMHEAIFTFHKGYCFFELDKYKESMEELEESILLFKKLKIEGQEISPLWWLCNVYLRLGYWEKLQERIEDFKKRNEKIYYSIINFIEENGLKLKKLERN